VRQHVGALNAGCRFAARICAASATGGKKQKTNAILRFTVITMAIILVASKNTQNFSNRVRQTLRSADAFLHKRFIV
jgi:hypothetical protein